MQPIESPSQSVEIPTTEPQRCSNSACPNLETDVFAELLVCSGCRTERYCSRECQKTCWKSHKLECLKLNDQRLNQVEKSTEEKAFHEYKAILRESMGLEIVLACTCPSALLMGETNSMDDSHLLLIHVSYKSPPVAVDQSDLVAVRHLFKFEGAEVVPNADIPKPLQYEHKIRRSVDKLKQVYYGMTSKTDFKPEELFMVLHRVGPRVLFNDFEASRYALNPRWQDFLRSCLESKVYMKDPDERSMQLIVEDASYCLSPQELGRQLVDSQRRAEMSPFFHMTSEEKSEVFERFEKAIEEDGEDKAFDMMQKAFFVD